MRWVGWGLLSLLLAVPAGWTDEPPGDKKKEPAAKDRYDALVKEFNARRSAILKEAREAKDAEQQKLIEQYRSAGKEFAERFWQVAEADPKGAAGEAALFWIVENATDSPVYAKAAARVTTLIAEMPVKDLATRLAVLRANPALLEAVLKRAEKEKGPEAADLLGWAATNGPYLPGGDKAIQKLIDRFPEHPAVERVCMILGQGAVPNGQDILKRLLEKGGKPSIKAAAALALGRALAQKSGDGDERQAEAEKYFKQAIELYGKDNEAQRKVAEGELKAFLTLRVGKEAPVIQGPDLDGKEFKLSDYRGKVVLLDFWGQW